MLNNFFEVSLQSLHISFVQCGRTRLGLSVGMDLMKKKYEKCHKVHFLDIKKFLKDFFQRGQISVSPKAENS